MDFSILQQCTIVELVQELRSRLQTDAAVMVGTQELGSLCNLIECILIDRYHQSYPKEKQYTEKKDPYLCINWPY